MEPLRKTAESPYIPITRTVTAHRAAVKPRVAFLMLGLCCFFGLIEVVSRVRGHVPGALVILGAAPALAAAFYLNSLEHRLSSMTVCEYRRITAAMTLSLLIMEVSVAVFCDFTPKNDLAYVCAGARDMVLGNDLYQHIPADHSDYFAIYPNNHALVLTISLLYRIEYALTGSITDTLPTAVNIAGLTLSYWLMCRCAELLHKPSRALVCAARGMLFTPFVTYAAFFYTDSLAMPLVIGGLYLWLCYRKNGGILRLIACGIVLGAAFRMKGSSGLIIAGIMYELIRERLRPTVAAGLLMPWFTICRVISLTAQKILHITAAELKEKSFPLIHWVMMSAEGRGGYQAEDYFYTRSFPGKAKLGADLLRLIGKLRSQGFMGFLAHLAEKTGYAWGGCTFMAPYYYGGVFSTGLFCAASFLLHFTVLFSLLLSLRRPGKRSRIPVVCLCGAILFFLLWETRCRYLVSLFPVFLLI